MAEQGTPLDESLVLHALVIKGFATVEALSSVTEMSPSKVTGILENLWSRELAIPRTGQIAGWTPTWSGRDIRRNLLSGPLAASDPDRMRGVYHGFAEVNDQFKRLCTRWQLRDSVANDHSDTAYDLALIAELAVLNEDAADLCDEMAGSMARVAAYRQRLADALEALQQGNRDKFTRPLCESYHDIWMELHHDLIVTLGLERTDADA